VRCRFARYGRWLRRGAHGWGGVAAVAVACSLLASSAQTAPPAAGTPDSAAGRLAYADSPTSLAQLEARAAQLSRQYRGQAEVLTGAETAASSAAARVRVLDRQLAAAHVQLARLAAASYMGSAPYGSAPHWASWRWRTDFSSPEWSPGRQDRA